MHAIKGGWVGQTFALAKCNDSGGKKSRIRRSKEERKEMVESFIKKYQSLNSGNFPSLNLTHKEVGGSFYTVREIVREVIQENRVLGPGKSLFGVQNANQLLEQHPLGTICTEPQIPHSVSSNRTAFVSDHGQLINEDSELISVGICTGPQTLGFDSGGKMINGSHATMENEESDKPKAEVIQLNEALETGKEAASSRAKVIQLEDVTEPRQLGFDSKEMINDGHVAIENYKYDEPKVEIIQLNEVLETEETGKEVVSSRAKVTQLEDVVVETFPLQLFPKSADKYDESSTEVKGFDQNFKEKDMERVQLESGKISLVDEITGSASFRLVGDKEMEFLVSPLLEGNSALVTKKALGDPLLESSDSSSTRQGIANDTREIVVEAQLSQPLEAVAETNVLNAQIVGQTNPMDGASARTSSGKLVTREIGIESKADVQHRCNSPKGNNPQLDRISLGSWDGSSRSPESETNPLWAIFKGFVTAFMKFWLE